MESGRYDAEAFTEKSPARGTFAAIYKWISSERKEWLPGPDSNQRLDG
jgi:hypothetical protein